MKFTRITISFRGTTKNKNRDKEKRIGKEVYSWTRREKFRFNASGSFSRYYHALRKDEIILPRREVASELRSEKTDIALSPLTTSHPSVREA